MRQGGTRRQSLGTTVLEDEARMPMVVATDATKLPPTGPEAAGSVR